MNTSLTVRLPAALVADLEAESCERHCSKSDVVRERLTEATRSRRPGAGASAIAGLVGPASSLTPVS
jgi:Arc/MetJ-type ribon-helix-helix transcriptional regulator